MSKKVLIAIIVLFALATTVLVLLASTQDVQSTPERTPTPAGLVTGGPPQLPRITDLAPHIPKRDKATLTILHPNGSYEEILLPIEMVTTFVRRLPPNDNVLTMAPPLSLREGPAPTPSRVTDLAPDIPRPDKETVTIQHPDGSYEEFLLPMGTTIAFIRDLPPSDIVVRFMPPPSIIERRPPSPPVEIQGTPLPPGRSVVTPVVSTPPPPPPTPAIP
jgi:hypothetical protein